MQILLDVHLSPRNIGLLLTKAGHTVLAASEDEALRSSSDIALLDYATANGFLVVTCDLNDFPALHWERVRRNIPTCGVLLSPFPNNAYGQTLKAIAAALEKWPKEDEWKNRLVFLSP